MLATTARQTASWDDIRPTEDLLPATHFDGVAIAIAVVAAETAETNVVAAVLVAVVLDFVAVGAVLARPQAASQTAKTPDA